MLIDRRNLSQHRPWMLVTLAIAVVATVWHVQQRSSLGVWPGGGSLSGFVFGVAGGLICLFEFALWIKKKPHLRNLRIGRAQTWLRAHIWFGLLAVPLLLFHSGWRLGGPLSTWVMALFLVVIASGVFGLALQQVLPKMMLDQIPDETIYSQIDHQAQRLIDDTRQWVEAASGHTAVSHDTPAAAAELSGATTFLVVGAVRSAGRVQGKVLETRVPKLTVEPVEAAALEVFFERTLTPYLREGSDVDSPLALQHRSGEIFRELRSRLSPAAGPVVDAFERASQQRRQFDQQARMHFWLHSWLWIHFPLSVALIVLMIAHAFFALWYL